VYIPPARRAPKDKNLAQQNTDFTSEGSPPPGKVATAGPATGDESAAQPIVPAGGAGIRSGRRPPFGRRG